MSIPINTTFEKEWKVEKKVEHYYQEIIHTLKTHDEWRSQTLNLSAAENVHSPSVKKALSSDLTQRYADYQGRNPAARKYQGTRYIQQLESLVTELILEVFHARYAEIRGISGHITDVAVMLGLTAPGGTILEIGSDPGGHGDGRKLCENPLIDAKIGFLPFDAKEYTVDLPQTIQMMREVRPSLIKLGTSSFLFPHPVAEIREEAERLGGMHVVYDASHVFGLIAGGLFQDPLTEGAQVMMGSTHKTMPGPQGGLILMNDAAIAEKVSAAVYPILVSNHHLSRLPGLSVALLELLAFGKEYAAQIVANARRLGDEIHRRGVPVVAAHKGYTRSHTILLQTRQFGDNHVLADRLDEANIIVNASRLPAELGSQGIRIGLQEITHLGAKEDDMEKIADFIVKIIRNEKSPAEIAPQIAEYRKDFQEVAYDLGSPRSSS
jgi:glycine hydroxymethyltransferase